MIEQLTKKLTISDNKTARKGLILVILLPVLYVLFVALRDFRGMNSAWAFNIGVNLMAGVVCIVIYHSCMQVLTGMVNQSGLFLSLLIASSISVFLAGSAWIVNGVARLAFWNRLFNVLLFTDNFILILLFWRFENNVLTIDKQISRAVDAYLHIFFVPTILCFLANLFFPILFSVDSLGFYRRERFFPLGLILFLPVFLGISIGIFKSKKTKKLKFIVGSFVGFPLFILIISLLKFNTSFLEPAIFFSIVIIYHMVIAEEAKRLALTQTELQVAANIQESMLPHVFPLFPEHKEFELYANMTPAREIGGDYFDFVMIDDDHLALLIADVSDKGVPAALFMMSTKNLINYRTRQGGTPAEILTDVNAYIAGDNESKMFVTVWMGILDLKSGVLTCTNAGHENPAIGVTGGRFKIFRDRHGFVLGVMPGVKYRDYELTMESGSKMFVYTDGVTDASNVEGERYGADRLEAALGKTDGHNPEEILHVVRADVDAFVDGAKQFDDMTMLCLEYKGGAAL